MIEPNMRTWLSCSTNTSTSATFYLKVATQGAVLPYGIVFKVSPGKDYTNSGSGLSESRMQCSCFSDSYYTGKMLASNVITAMEGWPKKTSSVTSTGVQAVFLAGETDLYDDASNIFHTALDFWVWHTQ